MENKHLFVEELSKLISEHCHVGVAKLEYVSPGETYNEEVIITYVNGYQKPVNVNMDSCLGIMGDVYKCL